MCWNIASLRSIEKDDAAILRRMVEREQPDILVLNEHKLSEELLDLTPAEEAEPAAAASSSGQASMLGFLVPAPEAAGAGSEAEKRSSKIVADAAAKASSEAAEEDGDDDDDDDDDEVAAAATAAGGKRSQMGKKQKQHLKLSAAKAASAKGKAGGAKPKKEKKAAVRFSARNIFGPGVFEHETWACSTKKKGYAGVALFSKTAPLRASTGVGNHELDSEGRAVVAEWPGLAVVGVYVPNSGQNLARLSYRTKVWDPAFGAMICRLEKERGRVLVIGDMNVALRDTDVYDPKRMRNKNAGFCDEERSNFASLIAPRGVTYGPPLPRNPEQAAKAAEPLSAASASSQAASQAASAVLAEGSSYSERDAINEAASAEPGIFGSASGVAGALSEPTPTITVVTPPPAAPEVAGASSSSSSSSSSSASASGSSSSATAAASASLPPPPPGTPAAFATGIAQAGPGLGLVDTWASQPENIGVAEWSFFSMRFGMRPKNKGWRIDYALASEKLWPSVTASYIRAKAIGSDHLPIGVEFDRDVLSKAP